MTTPTLDATSPAPTMTDPADEHTAKTQTGGQETILVRSSDGVVYKIHKLLLTLHCQGLPPPNCPTTSDGVFILLEPSSILERMLYYLYPRAWPNPLLSQLSLEEILATIRALDKYHITLAREPWLKRVRDSAIQSPIAALVYAADCRNQDLVSHVAPLVVQSNLALHKVLLGLPQAVWLEWFLYHDRWNGVFRAALSTFPMQAYTLTNQIICGSCRQHHCLSRPVDLMPQSQLQLLRKLGPSSNFADSKRIDDDLEKLATTVCSTCSHGSIPLQLQIWRRYFQRAIRGIPPPLLNLTLHTSKTAAPSSTPSKLFNFSDADIIIRSKDGIEFHVHKKILEACCHAFPPSSHPTMGEVVHLTESGSTLEMLFQFIYSLQQPNWEELTLSKLWKLAEAAEKYQVHMATYLLKILMTRFVPTHPAIIFAYATKHGYHDLADEVAPFLLRSGISVGDLVPLLIPNTVLAWARYLEYVWSLCDKAIYTLPTIPNHTTSTKKCAYCGYYHCNPSSSSDLSNSLAALIKEMVGSPEKGIFKFSALSQELSNSINHTDESRGAFKKWRDEINRDIENMPAFRKFL
ncbi:hypothetical protein AX16_005320 [Volvariella volvacea WC 439]|nr:hypothetical protein AX16_005320 [Volvariella volvacea WC 439]